MALLSFDNRNENSTVSEGRNSSVVAKLNVFTFDQALLFLGIHSKDKLAKQMEG